MDTNEGGDYVIHTTFGSRGPQDKSIHARQIDNKEPRLPIWSFSIWHEEPAHYESIIYENIKNVAELQKQRQVKISWDKGNFNYKVLPQALNGTTMVPLKSTLEAFGFSVEYNSENATVTWFKNGVAFSTRVDDATVKILDNHDVEGHYDIAMTQAITMMRGELMIPIRFAADIAGLTIGWDDETKTVLLEGDLSTFPQLSPYEAFKVK